MNTLGGLARRFVEVCVVGLGATTLCAQEKEEFRPQVALAVSGVYTTGASTPPNSSITISISTLGTVTSSTAVYGVDIDIPVGTKLLQIGREYTVTVSRIDIVSDKLSFNVPDDFVVFINKIERTYIANAPASFSLGVFRKTDFAPAPFGETSRLSVGAMVWSVSLGQLNNGMSAGSIAIVQPNLDSTAFQIGSLVCDPLSPEVQRIPATGTLQQVYSNAGLAVVSSYSNGFQIQFYPRSQVSGSYPGPYTPSGSPFVTYQVTQPVTNTFRVDKIVGVNTWRSELTKNTGPPLVWSLSDWTWLGHGTGHSETRSYSGTANRTEDVVVFGPSGNATVVTNTYTDYAWRRELTNATTAVSPSAVTRLTTFHNNTAFSGHYGHPSTIVDVDGNWTMLHYNDTVTRRGTVDQIYKPWLSTPATLPGSFPSGVPGTGEYIAITYGQPDWTGAERPTQIDRYLAGILAGRTTTSYGSETPDGESVCVRTINEYGDASTYVATTIKTYEKNTTDAYLRDLPYATIRGDGVVEAYVYHRGWVDPVTRNFVVDSSGGGRRQIRIVGSKNSSPGAVWITQFGPAGYVRQIEPMYVIPNDSILEETITSDTSGFLGREAMWFYASGSGQDVSSYNRANGRLYFRTSFGEVSSINDDGRGNVYIATWSDGVRTSAQDEAFQVTNFAYNAAGLLESSTRVGGSGGPPNVTTSFTYDAAGRLKSRSRDPSPSITETWNYDVGGRLTSRGIPGQAGTLTSTYSYANGSRDVTENLPNGASRTVTRHLDGPAISVTGTAVVPEYMTYTLAGDGYLTERVQHDNSGGDGAGVRKRNLDWLRRARLETVSTTTNGVEAGTRYGWTNVTGQLAWSQPTNNSWSPLGPATYMAYDTLGRVFRRWLDYDSTGSLSLGGPDRVSEYAYGFVPDGGQWWSSVKTYTYPFTSSATPLLVNEDRTRASFNGLNETTLSDSRSKDRFGNWTTTQTVVDRTNAIRYIRQTVPGSSTLAETEIRGGSVVRSVSAQNVTMLYAYDNWRRLIQQRRATSWPVPGNPGGETPGTDPLDMLERYTYYSGTDLVYTSGNWASYAFSTSVLGYDNMNRVISEVDANGQTRYRQYTTQGQLQYLWGSAQQPVRYDYDANYGWRTGMHTYRGGSGWTGATLPGDFSTAGETTTWVVEPRSGLITEKRDALYPAHPAVQYLFTNRNELYRRILARGSGSIYTTYSYDYATGELTNKDHNDSTSDVTFTYDRDGQLATAVDATGSRSFGYGSYRELTSESLPSSFFGSRSFAHFYFYSPGGGAKVGTLLATAFGPSSNPWAGPGNGNIHQTNYGYDWSKGRLSDVNRLYDSDPTQSFAYAYETNGNRITSVTNGTVYQLGTQWATWRNVVDRLYTYGNGLALKTEYQSDYDWAGRRTKETSWSAPSLLSVSLPIEQTWGLNARSEVTSEEIKENGTVNPAKARAYVWDNGWNRDTATKSGIVTTYNYASPSANQISNTTGSDPNEAATFTYDEDGNLTSDGTWTYSYDAENRLKGASSGTYNVGYTYDYVGRRVRKAGLSGPFFFSTTYVYDGWNLTAELDQSLNPLRTYTWGPDANGEIGVSGAKGLLMISSGSDRWYPTYDARHNVTGLLDASGNFVAAYTYDSFGRITNQQGTQAGNNPFGFATQFTDRDTGLIYFGHRFYSPKLGRLINRDPIEEAGGANLYAYAGNDVTNSFDVLGLLPIGGRIGGIFGDSGIFGDFGIDLNLQDTFNKLVSNYFWRTVLRVRYHEQRVRRGQTSFGTPAFDRDPAVPAANSRLYGLNEWQRLAVRMGIRPRIKWKPLSMRDLTLNWSPEAHDALIWHSLRGRVPRDVQREIQDSSRRMDKATQAPIHSHKHSMRQTHQTNEEAIQARDEFVRETIAQARAAAMAGNRAEALRLLGEAMHPIMDSSSPMHTDADGNPKLWISVWRSGIGHSPNDSIGLETTMDITDEIYESQDQLLRDLFDQVFRGTPLEGEVYSEVVEPAP